MPTFLRQAAYGSFRNVPHPGDILQTFRRQFVVAAILMALPCGQATARSKGAEFLVSEEIGTACEGKSGRIAAGAVIERDLTGDGRNDLIIFHHGITCSREASSERSIFCGMQACSIKIWVREGAILKLRGESLGVERIELGRGRIPTIQTFAHGGEPVTLKWDGKGFR